MGRQGDGETVAGSLRLRVSPSILFLRLLRLRRGGDVALSDLYERVFAQLLHVLLSRFFGSFHRRCAANGVLNVGVFKRAQGGGLSVVEPIYLESVLESDWLSHLSGFERRDGGFDLRFELAWFESTDLALLRARRATRRRVLLRRVGKALARPKLRNQALGPLIDFVSRVTFERQEDLRDRHLARRPELVLILLVEVAAVLVVQTLEDRGKHLALNDVLLLKALANLRPR